MVNVLQKGSHPRRPSSASLLLLVCEGRLQLQQWPWHWRGGGQHRASPPTTRSPRASSPALVHTGRSHWVCRRPRLNAALRGARLLPTPGPCSGQRLAGTSAEQPPDQHLLKADAPLGLRPALQRHRRLKIQQQSRSLPREGRRAPGRAFRGRCPVQHSQQAGHRHCPPGGGSSAPWEGDRLKPMNL